MCVPLCGNHLIVILLVLVIIIVGVGVGCGGGGLVVAGIEAAAEVEALHRRAVTEQAHRAGFLTTTPPLSEGYEPSDSISRKGKTRRQKAETEKERQSRVPCAYDGSSREPQHAQRGHQLRRALQQPAHHPFRQARHRWPQRQVQLLSAQKRRGIIS